ncbi:hypothetical protein K8I61_07180 [bacterium]|nr:hypothetical protein [bacterium]
MRIIWDKKTWLLTVLIFALSGALVACGGGDDDDDDDDDGGGGGGGDDDDDSDWRDALPDAASLAMTIPGQDEDDYYKSVGELATLYEETVDSTREVNYAILSFISIIDEITSYPPTSESEDTAVWGPWIDDGLSPVEMLFTMVNTGGEDYEYTLGWRAKNTEDEFTTVWSGSTTVSTDTSRRGVGEFYLDLDVAASLDPTVDQEGSISCDYDTVSDGREINVHWQDYDSEYEDLPGPITADYAYHNHADNTGEFTASWHGDAHWEEYHGDEFAKAEDVWFATKWQGNGVGRSDFSVTGGDVDDMQAGGFDVSAFLATECWGETFLRTYYSEGVVLVSDGEFYPGAGFPEGDEELCPFPSELI